MSMRFSAASALALSITLAACASTSETAPVRTATEQLLVARAADAAVDGLSLPVDRNAKIYVDSAYFAAESPAYAISAIRAELRALSLWCQ